MQNNSYSKLLLTLLLSFVVMYGVMFLNVYAADHIYLSITRLYMALLMVLPMAVLMLLMMGKMYPDKKKNTIIVSGSSLLFFIVLLLLRTQTPIGDVQYMQAMIPHHSSAILTSRNAHIQDPELKQLSQGIIAAQEKEIAQMKTILKRMKE
jgi:hypothetical protein